MNTEKSGLPLVRIVLSLFVLVLLAGAQAGSAEERRVVKLPGTANLPFSDGVIAGDTLYVAGQEGIDENGKLVPGGIGAESKATLARIDKIVQAAGFDLKDIVSVTVYLADIHDFPEMNIAYKAVMPLSQAGSRHGTGSGAGEQCPG